MLKYLFKRNRARLEHEKLKGAYKAVFATEAGLCVLEDLCTRFKRVQNPEKGQSMADMRAFNDGECSVVLRILKMLEDNDG